MPYTIKDVAYQTKVSLTQFRGFSIIKQYFLKKQKKSSKGE